MPSPRRRSTKRRNAIVHEGNRFWSSFGWRDLLSFFIIIFWGGFQRPRMFSSRLLAIVLWSIQLRPQIAAFHVAPLGLRCVSGGNTFTCPSNNPRSSWAMGARAARQRLGGRFRRPNPRMMAAAGGGGEGGDPRIQLPIIDLSPMMREGGGTAAELEAIGAQVREACMTDGIFYVSGHGVEEGKLNGALQASKSFFSLPQQDKELVTCPPGRGTGFTRGYIEMGGESGSDRLEVRAPRATKRWPHPGTHGDGRRFDFYLHLSPVLRHPFHLASYNTFDTIEKTPSFPFARKELCNKTMQRIYQSFAHATGKGGVFVWV
jgi:hypothetical protein